MITGTKHISIMSAVSSVFCSLYGDCKITLTEHSKKKDIYKVLTTMF